jgi:hypothetical protein
MVIGVVGSTDFIGYVACGLVLLTFCMQTMLPLRLVALASNFAFITYGWAAKLIPILILHCLLAIINIASLSKTVTPLQQKHSTRTPLHSSVHMKGDGERSADERKAV